LLSKQKAAASDESKCVETDWKMESENIMMKTDLKSKIGISEMSLHQVVRVLNRRLLSSVHKGSPLYAPQL
jgi:hypothetical protein